MWGHQSQIPTTKQINNQGGGQSDPESGLQGKWSDSNQFKLNQ